MADQQLDPERLRRAAPHVAHDIRMLREDMGKDIYFDRFKNGYVNRNPRKSLPQLELDEGEVFVLTLGKDMLAEYAGTSFEGVLRAAIEKIHRRLPDRVQIDADDIRSMVKFSTGPVIHASRKMFMKLNRACEKNIPVAMTYKAANGETTDRVMEPYRLLQQSGAWYVLAYCRLRKAFRLFALHRITHYHLRDERFEVQEDFDADAWTKQLFQVEHRNQIHRIKVRFAPSVAVYIKERTWHPTQTLTEHSDGSCTLEFDIPSLEEAKRWVLSYGSDAEVIEPQEFRSSVAEELQRARSAYS